MKRLCELTLMDGAELIYCLPEGECLGVFDGPVMLEESCYRIDMIDMRLKLKRPPMFEVRALMFVHESGHRTNFITAAMWAEGLPLKNAGQH